MSTTPFSMYRPPNRVGFAKFQTRSAESSVESSLAAGECDFTDRLVQAYQVPARRGTYGK